VSGRFDVVVARVAPERAVAVGVVVGPEAQDAIAGAARGERGTVEGLDRFVHPDKSYFVGRDAVVWGREQGLNWNYVTLEVHGVTDAGPRGNEPIYNKGKLVGRATNGGFGWRVNKSLALAMVHPDHAKVGTTLTLTLTIRILGKDHAATIIPESPYDPDNTRLRASLAPQGSDVACRCCQVTVYFSPFESGGRPHAGCRRKVNCHQYSVHG
jgi:hypothetical protein